MVFADSLDLVVSGLWFWQVYDPEVRVDLSSSSVQTPEGLVLIDPVAVTSAVFAELEEKGKIAGIALTNGNHARSAALFRDCWKVPIFAHQDAVEELGLDVDVVVSPGETVCGVLEVVSLEGAGPGEIAYWNREQEHLHVGDALINLGETGLTPLPAKYCSNPRQLQRSLQRLKELPVRIATFAHGLPLVSKTAERIKAAI